MSTGMKEWDAWLARENAESIPGRIWDGPDISAMSRESRLAELLIHVRGEWPAESRPCLLADALESDGADE